MGLRGGGWGWGLRSRVGWGVSSISLTCARFDANGVDGWGQLQPSHQLIGRIGLLGLAVMVTAVDTAAGGVASQVRPPRPGGPGTWCGAATTPHSTCLKYDTQYYIIWCVCNIISWRGPRLVVHTLGPDRYWAEQCRRAAYSGWGLFILFTKMLLFLKWVRLTSCYRIMLIPHSIQYLWNIKAIERENISLHFGNSIGIFFRSLLFLFWFLFEMRFSVLKC